MYIGKQYYAREQNYQTLDMQQRRQIHSAALRLLWEHGMSLHQTDALALLQQAGAVAEPLDGGDFMVHLPPALVEWAIRQAPSQVTLFDRNGKPAMFLEGKNVYYGTGSDTVMLSDYASGESRPWTKDLVAQAARLCDALEHIDFVMSMGLISDVHYAVNTREQYAALIRNTVKPQVVVCDGKEDLADVFRMFIAVRGSAQALRLRPYAAVYNEPTSPLVNSDTAMEKLLLCADYGVPANYATGSMSGATTPMSAAGTIVLSTAECLFGLTVHQLRQAGAPFIFGSGDSPMDMKTVQADYAHPVCMQIQGGMCDMARYYNLPCWGQAGEGCSKLADEQAIQEGTFTLQMAALQGSNLTHDVGYNNFGLGFSFETLAMHNNCIGQIKELMKGVEVNEETLAVDLIMQTGCNGNFLRSKMSRQGAKTMWRGQLNDYQAYKDWQAAGSLSMGARAHALVQHILAHHHAPALDPAVDRQIEAILENARHHIQA